MKKDIIQESLARTKEYLQQLNTSKHFEDLTKKYVKLHNKNIFVKFSYISNETKGLFSVLIRKYNLNPSILDNLRLKHSNNKNWEISKLEKKIEQDIQSIRSEDSKWRSVSKDLEENLINNDLFDNNTTTDLIQKLLSNEKAILKTSLMNKNKMIQAIKNVKKNIREIENDTFHNEKIIFQMVLKKYMEMVEISSKNVFFEKKISISYNSSEWNKKYEEAQKNRYFDIERNDELSDFENFIFNVIQKNKFDFDILIFDGECKYTVDRKSWSIERIKGVKDEQKHIKVKIDSLEKELNNLYKNNPNFHLIIQSLNLVNRKFSAPTMTSSFLIQHLFQIYGEELIQKYNQIANELSQLMTQQNVPFSHRNGTPQKLTDISEKFNDVGIEIIQKLNWGYKVINKEVYDDFIYKIENDEYVLFYCEPDKEKVIK